MTACGSRKGNQRPRQSRLSNQSKKLFQKVKTVHQRSQQQWGVVPGIRGVGRAALSLSFLSAPGTEPTRFFRCWPEDGRVGQAGGCGPRLLEDSNPEQVFCTGEHPGYRPDLSPSFLLADRLNPEHTQGCCQWFTENQTPRWSHAGTKKIEIFIYLFFLDNRHFHELFEGFLCIWISNLFTPK